MGRIRALLMKSDGLSVVDINSLYAYHSCRKLEA